MANSQTINPELRRVQKAAFGNQLALFSIGVLALFSGFVLFEPAPYEFAAALFIPFFFIAGLTYSSVLAAPTALLIAFFIGGLLSSLIAPELDVAITHVLITGFLALTALFFAAMIASDPGPRLQRATHAYALSAVIVSLLGVLGYLGKIPFADTFVLYDRAKSTFKDPNVFSAFLIYPMVYALLCVLMGTLRQTLIWGIVLLILAAGLFLSYSRGAWGGFAFSAVFAVFLSFIVNRSAVIRARILLLSVIGVLIMLGLIFTLLSIDQVSSMFSERAQLTLPYDEGQFGRLNRQFIGFSMALENPLGIGFRAFAKIFGEDTHNIYLQGFLTYSWVGGISYAALIVITLIRGFGVSLRATPWRNFSIAIYATFFGMALQGWLIDTDHWRHWFMLLGMLWGIIAYESRARRMVTSAAPRS
ncbi:MAG: O-antigen ligase family protein [Pseudomonadota bacterium]